MSSIIEELNSIYQTKLQIKDVIGTQSDIFSDYPAYIAAAIGTGGPIDWDEVAAYGYIIPAGYVTIGQNGNGIDVANYSTVNVNVPTGVVPTGTKTIAENGTHDVASYAYAYVAVTATAGAELTEVFGADEYDSSKYIPFVDAGDAFTYSFQCTWDGSDWSGSLSNNGFALVGRMGSATQYDYDDQTGTMVLNNSYCALSMHVANGAFYLGDIIGAGVGTLAVGSIDIATNINMDTKFQNNGFGAGPENTYPTDYSSGTLSFVLTVPKDLVNNYNTGYDYIESGNIRQINHPTVNLSWSFSGTPA